MTRGRLTLAVVSALLAGLAWGGGASAAAGSVAGVPWSALRFEAERLGNRVAVEVRVEPEPAAPPPGGLWPAVRGEPLRPSGPSVVKLTVLATIDPIGISPIRMEGRVWLDPATGTPLRASRSRRGIEDYVQWFVFGREGVFRRQIEPRDATQAAGPVERWTRVSENVYAGPADAARCPAAPVETLMLFYLMSGSAAQGVFELDPRCVFHKRQLHLVRFGTERRERVAFDYLERSGDASERRSGSTRAVTIRLSSAPIGSYHGDVERFFKDSELTVSADGRVPLTGALEFPVVGRVDLRLTEIRLEPPSSE
jgi:hypothetical protein